MHETRQFERIETEVVIWLANETREDREEVKNEVSSKFMIRSYFLREIMPSCSSKSPLITWYFEVWKKNINQEEDIIDKLKGFYLIVVFWENKTKQV